MAKSSLFIRHRYYSELNMAAIGAVTPVTREAFESDLGKPFCRGTRPAFWQNRLGVWSMIDAVNEH